MAQQLSVQAKTLPPSSLTVLRKGQREASILDTMLAEGKLWQD